MVLLGWTGLLLVARSEVDYVGAVSRVEEIERVIEQLPREDFEKLSTWMAQRCAERGREAGPAPPAFRDHRAFLNSYTTEDEGLYDDAAGR